jgi:hypothetical protein
MESRNWSISCVWFIWFVWLAETRTGLSGLFGLSRPFGWLIGKPRSQMNQTNQRNQMNKNDERGWRGARLVGLAAAFAHEPGLTGVTYLVTLRA